jgi:cbb3-type cytochrome oxidase maturation protein
VDGIIFLIPIALGLGGVFAVLFVGAVGRGQFDDLDDAPQRMLHDEDP